VATCTTREYRDSLLVLPPDSLTVIYICIELGIPHDMSQDDFATYLESIRISKGDSILFAEAPADKTRWDYSEDAMKLLGSKWGGDSTYTLTLTGEGLEQ
jgi:hypothetical protein